MNSKTPRSELPQNAPERAGEGQKDEHLGKAVSNVARGQESIIRLWIQLVADVATARAAMVSNDTQFARRQFVRATFAKLEGFTSALKQFCLRSPTLETDCSAAEIALLREETFSLDDKGEPRVTANHLKLAANIQFAFRMYARFCDLRFSLHTSESEWSDLKLAMAVRNRLMHPKKPEDLTVSEAEVKSASRASEWIDAKHRELQDLAMDKGDDSGGASRISYLAKATLGGQAVIIFYFKLSTAFTCSAWSSKEVRQHLPRTL
jgi:hypothetical protein